MRVFIKNTSKTLDSLIFSIFRSICLAKIITNNFIIGGETLSIAGSSFSVDSKVNIDTKECTIVSAGANAIQCTLPENEPGIKKCAVVRSDGFSSTDFDIEYVLSLTNVSPNKGSYAGGSILTITGEGFGTVDSDVEVKVGNKNCEVLTVTDTTITCKQPSITRTVKVDNGGQHASKSFIGHFTVAKHNG